MIQKILEVLNPKGIHARPSALLIIATQKYQSIITIELNDTAVQANSVLNILMLNASYKSKLSITVDGIDEKEAMAAVEEILGMTFEDD